MNTGFLFSAAAMIALLTTGQIGCAQTGATGETTERAITSADLDVPYVPTPQAVVDEMLKVAKVGKDDYVIDLGSGDGRIVITAAQKYGARGKGIDLNPERIKESRENAKKAGVTDRVTFENADLFQTEIKDATVLTMYLLSDVNLKLRPRILSELRPGTRVVSHAFDLGDWKPDEHRTVENKNVYFWVVPAQVAGQTSVNLPGEQGTMQLNLKQRYQEVEGTARIGDQEMKIQDGRLTGEQIRFTLVGTGENAESQRFEGRVAGKQITGSLSPIEATRVPAAVDESNH